MGVWRLSKRNALVRKMVMVETLGSVTTICTDKTGTLTEGKMSLNQVFVDGKFYEVNNLDNPAEISTLIKSAVLAMERVAIDPMEIELQRFAKVKKIVSDEFYSKYTIVKDGSFDASSKMVHHIWESDKLCYQYSAGAPESVIGICRWPDQNKKNEVIAAYEKFASQGYRVVGIAKTEAIDCTEFKNSRLQFAGLLALSDPPRFGVKEAMEVCEKAGVRVVMITGDHSLTAKAIAAQIGLKNNGEVMEGSMMDKLEPGKLRDVVRRINIFARIRPEQKYAIIEALEANEEIVAMTGDGVNDAPALKKATVGIAMGKKGTDVARAAAGVILMDDNFTTIVKALEEGRRIYANMRRAFGFLVSFHMPIVGMAIIPILLGQELYFLPIHIIFLEFFCDPATVIGLEQDPIEKGAMSEKPRPINEPLINSRMWWKIVWQGTGIIMVALIFYGFGLWVSDIPLGRTMSFAALVVAQLSLMLINRDFSQIKNNHVLLWLVIIAFVSLNAALFIPVLRGLFHFVRISPLQYFYSISAAVASSLYFNLIAKGKMKYFTQEK
jgi:Ca2+-transporting ATPase